MLDDLRARGVKFYSLTEAIDTATPTGRAMWQMIGVPGRAPAQTSSGSVESIFIICPFLRKPFVFRHASGGKADPLEPQGKATFIQAMNAVCWLVSFFVLDGLFNNWIEAAAFTVLIFLLWRFIGQLVGLK